MQNVVELNPETIVELRRKKLLREQQESIDLLPVGPGEVMIGYLSDEERQLYVEMVTLDHELQENSRELQARSLEMVAASVRKSETPHSIQKNLDDTILFPTKEEAEEHYKIETTLNYLKAIYAMSLRGRYGYTGIYGVRTGFCVVRTGYRHKLPDELRNARQ
jgi:hypothetical protein